MQCGLRLELELKLSHPFFHPHFNTFTKPIHSLLGERIKSKSKLLYEKFEKVCLHKTRLDIALQRFRV